MKKVIFSGIQPTASAFHIGNYLGALKQWLELQKQNDCFFSVVDLHALTINPSHDELYNATCASYALLLAIGIDPKLSTIFVQSQVSEHSELTWLLNCFTSVGQLSRMTQYKEKSQKHKKFVSAGLYDYPVLMAADILLYSTDAVPVGEDQIQHIELTRDIAQRFNNLYGETFVLPKPYLIKDTARIMSLQQPNAKMSKSDLNLNATIFVEDSPDLIVKKIKSAVTDSVNQIKFDKSRAGLFNLLSIYRALTKQSEEGIEQKYRGVGYGQFKTDLAEIIIETLSPIRKRYQDFIKDRGELEKLAKLQSLKAKQVASKKLIEVKKKIGLLV